MENWDKTKLRKLLTLLVEILAVISFFYYKNLPTQNIISATNSINTIGQIGDNTLVVNENKQIPYSKIFKTNTYALRTVDKTMLNVKYFLPNNKEAFISRLDKGQEYILFYTNDDISDIYIPENYRFSNNLEPQVCWGITVLCTDQNCGYSELQKGPHLQNRDNGCFSY